MHGSQSHRRMRGQTIDEFRFVPDGNAYYNTSIVVLRGTPRHRAKPYVFRGPVRTAEAPLLSRVGGAAGHSSMCNYTGISATVYGSKEYGLRSACIRAVKEPISQKGVRGRAVQEEDHRHRRRRGSTPE